MTGRAGRVEHHVAELAGQARVPAKRDAVGDDPAADSDLAGDVDDVVAVPGGSAYVLGERPQVRVVAQMHAQLGRHQLGEHPRERAVPPAEVGSEVNPPVGPAHGAGNAHADTDRPRARRYLLAQWIELFGDLDRDLVGRVASGLDARLAPGYDVPAESHSRADQPVDLDVDRERERAVQTRTDHVRGPPGAFVAARHVLVDQPERDQLADQGADRRAVQAQALGQLGAGQLTVAMNLLEQQAEVVPPYRFGTGSGGASHRRVPPLRRRPSEPGCAGASARQGVHSRGERQHATGDDELDRWSVLALDQVGHPVDDDGDDQATDDRVGDLAFAA